MTRIRIAPEAEEDLDEAARWYEKQRAGLGVELVAVIDRELEAIADAPLANPSWRSDRAYRMRVVSRFPYVIFFSIGGEAIVVLAIAHGRRRPGYWLDRR